MALFIILCIYIIGKNFTSSVYVCIVQYMHYFIYFSVVKQFVLDYFAQTYITMRIAPESRPKHRMVNSDGQ